MKKSYYPNEFIIIGIILILSGFGIVMMYSASSIYAMNKYNNYMFFLNQQIKWLALGITFMFLISRVNYQVLKKYAYLLLIFSWIILIMGYFLKGNNPASRWLVIGGRSWLTTSDFARLSLIIFTAFFIEKNKNYMKDMKFVLTRYTPFMAITLLLILFQPDTSTTIAIAIIIILMLLIRIMMIQFKIPSNTTESKHLIDSIPNNLV